MNKALSYCLVVCWAGLTAGPGAAQDKPLSVIDWLDQKPQSVALPNQAPPEAPVAQSGTTPQVQTAPLGTQALRQIGLVPPDVTNLPADIWRNSDVNQLVRLLGSLPDAQLPAAQALLYTLVLAEAQGPEGDADAEDAFTLARVDALVRYGALDPAMALIEQAGVDRDAAHFAAFMDVALLTGSEDTACAILAAQPHLAPSHAHRVFCAARRGDWATGALLWETGSALGLLTPQDTALLDRFLNPDLFEDAAPLPQPLPARVTPLSFRLHETIGEPLSSRPLPRAYAVADLRDLTGWKAQLEAAERLTRSGALPENRLLGIYTARLPAASGGIWDRVAALQRFETALRTRSVDAVTKTLPPVWAAMQAAELEVSFASLFGDGLGQLNLSGPAAGIAQKVRLLSPDRAEAARQPSGNASALLNGIALGQVDGLKANTDLGRAILRAWTEDTARPNLVRIAQSGRVGEALLRTLLLLNDGAEGDLNALSTALGTLRALGQEDTARSAAIQTVLLERQR